MKTAFKILPQLQQDGAYHLLIELGWEVVSFVYFTKDPLCIEALYIYHVPKDSSAAGMATELEKVLENTSLPQHLSCHICYSFREHTLIPSDFIKQAERADVLNLLFGSQHNALPFAETVEGMDLAVAHRVDKKMEALLLKYFPGAIIHHSLALQLPQWAKESNALICTVHQQSIHVVLFKEGQLQIARSFNYSTPADVAYHLLNVCTQHEFSPESGELILSGFIDHKSNLYDELYRYFLNIRLHEGNPAVATSQAVSQYPAHFFSPLTQLVSCVS